MAEKIKKTSKEELITAVGRRKTSVASIFLTKGKGEFKINGKDIETYYPSEKDKSILNKVFFAVGISNPQSVYGISIKVLGGGKSGQLGAITLAISRALSKVSSEYHSTLNRLGFLTRDPRMVERKKYYLVKARKAPQYSKR